MLERNALQARVKLIAQKSRLQHRGRPGDFTLARLVPEVVNGETHVVVNLERCVDLVGHRHGIIPLAEQPLVEGCGDDHLVVAMAPVERRDVVRKIRLRLLEIGVLLNLVELDLRAPLEPAQILGRELHAA